MESKKILPSRFEGTQGFVRLPREAKPLAEKALAAPASSQPEVHSLADDYLRLRRLARTGAAQRRFKEEKEER